MALNGASAGSLERSASPGPSRPPGPLPTSLILASASPRRLDLLRAVGVEPEVHPVDLDETPHPGERPPELVLRLARAKAEAALEARSGRRGGADDGAAEPAGPVVIGADTVVVVDHEIFGKPADDDEAVAMLSRLSGRDHRVVTGVAVAMDGRHETALDETVVRFAHLSEADIARYVATGEPRGKAGAYAIQGRGGLFVEGIDGSYHNVVGLPVRLVDQLCRRLGCGLSCWSGRNER